MPRCSHGIPFENKCKGCWDAAMKAETERPADPPKVVVIDYTPEEAPVEIPRPLTAS